MKKLPYIRQGQQLTIDILNGIIKAINSSILERKEYDSMMADITRMFNSYQSKVDNFILKYQDVVDNTPGLMDLLQSYSTLASMVNGTYVASVGSVNITAAGFNIKDTMTRSDFEEVRGYAERYEQYSSLLITEEDEETTLVYNVAPLESTPIWIEIDRIAGPQGPPGPRGIPGPSGENGEDGRDGQITSIKGKVASLDECLELGEPPTPGDAYVVEGDNDDVALYVYVGGAHTEPSSWVTLNNIRGPAGPQGDMAKITIQYSNYYDGSSPSSSYNGQSFLVLTEEGKIDPHIIQISPKLKFEIVDIEESNEATVPYAEHTYVYTRSSNEHKINTKITIPTLKTVEGASLVDNKYLHLQYRGDAGTTNVGRVVYDPSKIVFTNSLADFNISTVRDGDVVIDTSDYSIYHVVAGTLRLQGSLQGPPGPVGPVGASFKLVGNWAAFGEVSATAGNIGNAYFLPEDDGDHPLGLYVSSEISTGVYGWVFAGNSEGPQGPQGARGALGPRGARITSGVEFYLDDNRVPCAPLNPDNAYQQGDLYLNTATWDLFRVEQIDPAPDYTILPSHIGNIKGEGITDIAFNSAAETLTITYSGGLQETVHIETIHVSSAEYSEVGLVVHKTDGSDKGVFAIDNTIGEQIDPNVPASFNLWGDETDLRAPSGEGSAGNSTLIPRADHVHPAQTNITGNAESATRLGTTGTPAASNKLVLGDGQAPGTVGSTAQPIYLNAGVPTTVPSLKAHSFVAPSTTQGTGTTTVPCDNLLTQSSFARVYRTLADLELNAPLYLGDIVNAMKDNSMGVFLVDNHLTTFNIKTGEAPFPTSYGVLTIIRRNSVRIRIEFNQSLSATGNVLWFCDWDNTNMLAQSWVPISIPISTVMPLSSASASDSKVMSEKLTYDELLKKQDLQYGYLVDSRSNFSSYWGKVAEIDVSSVSVGDVNLDFFVTNNYYNKDRLGILRLGVRKASGVSIIATNYVNLMWLTKSVSLSSSGFVAVVNGLKVSLYHKPMNQYGGTRFQLIQATTTSGTHTSAYYTLFQVTNSAETALPTNDGTVISTMLEIEAPTIPSGPSSAVAKSYVDTTTINPNILTNADFLVNDLGTAVYDVHDTPTVNNWKIKLTNTAGSYTVATKTLKSNNVDIGTDYVHLYQEIPNPMFYNGKTVTFSAKAISTTGKWTLILWKGVSAIASVPWDTALFKTLTYAIPAGTFTSGDTFSVAIRGYSSTVLDYAKLEVGSVATAFSPAQNTMLITASPTSNSMAVNKEHLDEETDNLRTTLNDLFTRLVIAEASSQKIFFIKSGRASNISATQDGSSVSTGFTGVSSKVIVITLTRPANTSTYAYYFSGWTKDGLAITSGSDGFIINYNGNTSTLTFTYENGKGGTYQGDVSRYTITPGPTPEPL